MAVAVTELSFRGSRVNQRWESGDGVRTAGERG